MFICILLKVNCCFFGVFNLFFVEIVFLLMWMLIYCFILFCKWMNGLNFVIGVMIIIDKNVIIVIMNFLIYIIYYKY